MGVELPELGRVREDTAELRALPEDVGVVAEINKRKSQVRATLRAMEDGEPAIAVLWHETKQWSLEEFHRIYAWLDCRFDHDFCESEVGEESRELVQAQYAAGVLTMDRGAIVADLTEHKLGHVVLLKSNGAGLYATKDLSLAQRKFERFQIERSIYVVDVAQTLHFQQVFKVLELFGYEQAIRCVHQSYGQVVLPSGKMSSRKGNVIMFSTLKDMLAAQIKQDFLAKYEREWPAQELAQAVRALSVATIKYGMLNHDTSKDIVFELKDWTARGGNNGPYMLYAYARIASILREVKAEDGVPVRFGALTAAEKPLLLHLAQFWEVSEAAYAKHNPSMLCTYLFTMSKALSSWYELDTSFVKTQAPERKNTLLSLLAAVGKTIRACLGLLGISTIERM